MKEDVLRLAGLVLLIAMLTLPVLGCGDGDDCSGDGANCALIATGQEPPCCEGLVCQESIIAPGFIVCR